MVEPDIRGTVEHFVPGIFQPLLNGLRTQSVLKKEISILSCIKRALCSIHHNILQVNLILPKYIISGGIEIKAFSG